MIRAIATMPRVDLGVCGLALLAPSAALLALGRPNVAFLAMVLGVMVGALARVAPGDVRRMATVAMLAKFGFQLSLGIALQLYAEAQGHPDYVIGDDGTYLNAASTYAAFVRGEVGGGAILAIPDVSGIYTYTYAALILLFGRDPLVGVVLNSALAATLVLISYLLARRLFGSRLALVPAAILMIHPSLSLWSAVNLKEVSLLVSVGLVLLLLAKFQSHPSWRVLLLAFVAVLAVETLRRPVFLWLVPLVVLGVALAPIAASATRWRFVAGAMVGAAALLVFDFVGVARIGLPMSLSALEGRRVASGITAGAKTAFQVEFAAEIGQTFVIASPTPNAAAATAPPVGATPTNNVATHAPPATQTVVVVPPGTRIVVVSSTSSSVARPTSSRGETIAPITPPPGTVFVRPGDVVVVGPPGTTPRPADQPIRLDLPSSEPSLTLLRSDESTVAPRTLAYLPRGITYTLLAPFPWEARRLVDLATIPDMLLWYGLIVAGAWTVWRRRLGWRVWSVPLLFVLGVLGMMVLGEGNVGTIYRHRVMVIPTAAVLAAPGIVALWEGIGSLLRSRRHAQS